MGRVSDRSSDPTWYQQVKRFFRTECIANAWCNWFQSVPITIWKACAHSLRVHINITRLFFSSYQLVTGLIGERHYKTCWIAFSKCD
jgi:hypothetical protein